MPSYMYVRRPTDATYPKGYRIIEGTFEEVKADRETYDGIRRKFGSQKEHLYNRVYMILGYMSWELCSPTNVYALSGP